MSQYTSRIHIKVTSPSVWGKFAEADDAEFGLAELENSNTTSFIVDGEWSCFENEMDGIVNALAETLQGDGIIIADTTNINVDPYNYCVYYLGSYVKTHEFGWRSSRANMNWDTDIQDIVGWLNYAGFSASESEEAQLLKCGIAAFTSGKKTVYESFEPNIGLSEIIRLREIVSKEQISHIETLNLLDAVTLKCTISKSDGDQVVEAVCKGISIGVLPANEGAKIYPVLSAGRMAYEARIVRVTPLSKRNRHAGSPIVELHIEASKVFRKGIEKKQSSATAKIPQDTGEASSFAISLARSVSDRPAEIVFENMLFVHTSCTQEKAIDAFVEANGGEVKSSVVLKTNYLIVGNGIDHETTKISRARELNGQGKTIVAMTESEFWSFATAGKGTSLPLNHEEAPQQAQVEEEVDTVVSEADMSVWEKYIVTQPTGLPVGKAVASKAPRTAAMLDNNTGPSVLPEASLGEENDRWPCYLNGTIECAQVSTGTRVAPEPKPAGNSTSTTTAPKKPDAVHTSTTPTKEAAGQDEAKRRAEQEMAEAAKKREEEQRKLAEEKAKAEEARKQMEAAAQARALEQIRKAAEEEKKRKEEQQRKLVEEKAKAEAEARRIAEENARAEEERKQKEAEKEAYEVALAQWTAECERIKRMRDEKLQQFMAEEKKTRKAAVIKAKEEAVAGAEAHKAEAQKKKTDAEQQLKTLGLFKFGAKKEARAAIEEADAQIAKAESDIQAANLKYQKDSGDLEHILKDVEAKQRAKIIQETPFPSEPVMPDHMKKETRNGKKSASKK